MIAAPTIFACAVCFGGNQANSGRAANVFILSLVGLSTLVLGAFGIFALYLARKEKQAALHSPDAELADSDEEPYPTPRWEWKADSDAAASNAPTRGESRHGHPHASRRRFTFPE